MKKVIFAGTAAVLILGIGVYAGLSLRGVEAAPAANARIYELRTYFCHEGKLDDLNARFANHTNRLFVKHGMTLVGYWTPADEGAENTLVYIVGHESRDAAKANWAGFVADEEWKAAKAESEKDGAIVERITSQYLVPTDYSPLR